ncbi:hypothetical protein [Alkalihalobacillus deserti]|uniref:hypothetical protein n=1 Tax=Alkalihalobacillus deserti TaxID=2879466 RepID=UPI001D15BB55|nr:hypothetical protein [Alkalihalobacillus deserti]
MVLLAQKEVEAIMSKLNDEQVYFLTHRMKIKKKSRWLQVLANYKGIDINETMSHQDIEGKIKDWVLIDILDGGYKKRPHKCDCGQSLRFQYLIQNKKEGAVRYLGENCFENYLSLPSSVIKDVKNGMYAIDLERDDILVKYKKNLFYPLASYLHLSLPQDIIDQYEAGLPLSDNQIALVERINARYEEEKKLSFLFQRLNIKQQQFVSKMNPEDRRELLLSIEDGIVEGFFQDEEISEYEETTQRQIQLHLPLLERQKVEVKEWKLAKKRQEQLHSLTLEQREFVLSFTKEEQEALLDRVQKPLYYSIESIKNLPLDARIKKQVELNLPLLKEQLYKINVAQNRFQNLS